MVRKFKYTETEHSFMAGRFFPLEKRKELELSWIYDCISIMDDLEIAFKYLNKYHIGFESEYIDEVHDAIFLCRRFQLNLVTKIIRRLLFQYIDSFDYRRENIKFSKTKVKNLAEFKEKLVGQFDYIFSDSKRNIKYMLMKNKGNLLNDEPYHLMNKDTIKEISKLLDDCVVPYLNEAEVPNKFCKFLKDKLTYKYIDSFELYDIRDILEYEDKYPIWKLKNIVDYILYKHPEYMWMVNYYLKH